MQTERTERTERETEHKRKQKNVEAEYKKRIILYVCFTYAFIRRHDCYGSMDDGDENNGKTTAKNPRQNSKNAVKRNE